MHPMWRSPVSNIVFKKFVSPFSAVHSPTAKPLPETSSFVMNIFRGKLSVDHVFPFPKVLSPDSIRNLREIVAPLERFLQAEVDAAKHDNQGKFDEKTLATLAEFGAYGLQAPEKYDGVGLNNTEYARLVNLIGMSDLALGIHLGAHQSIGYKGITIYGSDQQKAKYLPDLASGKRIAAYCLTEPSSGSDASSIQSKAELSADGKHYVLNGTKVWISNGGLADVFTVFARTPVKGNDGKTQSKITAFIVERSFGGVTHSEPEEKMGIHASNTVSLYFDDCKVPVENVLGNVGEGFKVAVNILNQGRFGMAAALSGTMRVAIQRTISHAVQRTQFGHTLNEFQNVQEKLVSMLTRHYITESMAFMLSGSMDLGAQDFQLEAAISKIYSSEAAWYCIDEALQIHGGTGYMKHAQLERILRDLRVFRIFEGANDVLRLFVALTGLNYAGKHLTAASKSPLGVLGIGVSQFKRILGMSGDGKHLKAKLPAQLSGAAKLTGEAIDFFGHSSLDLITRYRKDVIGEQFRLIRLANAAIEIYAMMCVLSRATKSMEEHSDSADHEVRLANLACQQAYRVVERNLSELGKDEDKRTFDSIKSLSSEVFKLGDVVYPSPLGF